MNKSLTIIVLALLLIVKFSFCQELGTNLTFGHQFRNNTSIIGGEVYYQDLIRYDNSFYKRLRSTFYSDSIKKRPGLLTRINNTSRLHIGIIIFNHEKINLGITLGFIKEFNIEKFQKIRYEIGISTIPTINKSHNSINLYLRPSLGINYHISRWNTFSISIQRYFESILINDNWSSISIGFRHYFYHSSGYYSKF